MISTSSVAGVYKSALVDTQWHTITEVWALVIIYIYNKYLIHSGVVNSFDFINLACIYPGLKYIAICSSSSSGLM